MADRATRAPATELPRRVPPHNLAAEESLLGALLLSRDAISAVAELHLHASDFYKPAHQHVFEAIRVLAASASRSTPSPWPRSCAATTCSTPIGGPTLLVDLQAATPAISNAARYARIVQDTAMLRRLISVAGEIAELGYDEPDDVTKALDVAESKVFELADRRVIDSTKPIGDLLSLAINDLEQAYERGTALTGIAHRLHRPRRAAQRPAAVHAERGRRPARRWASASPGTPSSSTRPPASWSPPPSCTGGAPAATWVQVVSLDRATAACVVATPSAFVDDGVKPVYRVTHPARADRAHHAQPSVPHRGRAGGRWPQLAVGDRIAVPAPPALVRHPSALGPRRAGRRGPPPRRRRPAQHAAPGAGRSSSAGRRSLDLDVPADAAPARPLAPRRRRAAHPAAVFRACRASSSLPFLERLWPRTGGARPAALAYDPFAARSERLVRDVQHLFLRFGVVTELRPRTVDRRRRGRTGRPRARPRAESDLPRRAELELPSPRCRRAAAPAPPTAPAASRRSRSSPDTDVCWDEIVDIAHEGDEQVYDLTVPGHHNFVAADVSCTTPPSRSASPPTSPSRQALPVLFFSLEMGHKELTQRILSSEARVDSSKMRTGRLTEQDWSKIGKAIGRLEAPLFIDDNPNVTVMEIRAKARRLKARHGSLGLVVVDYLQLMSGRASAENRQVEVSEISRGLKILARELEVPDHRPLAAQPEPGGTEPTSARCSPTFARAAASSAPPASPEPTPTRRSRWPSWSALAPRTYLSGRSTSATAWSPAVDAGVSERRQGAFRLRLSSGRVCRGVSEPPVPHRRRLAPPRRAERRRPRSRRHGRSPSGDRRGRGPMPTSSCSHT